MDKDMRRKIDMIKAELTKRGHEVTEKKLVKNGIKRYALVVTTEGNTHPLIYVDRIIVEADEKNMLFEDIIEVIEEQIKKMTSNPINFEIAEIITRDNMLKHSRILAQKISDDGAVKRPGEFEGTEYVLKMKIDYHGNVAHIKVNKELMKIAQVEEEELWQQALENTRQDVVIKSMAELIEERAEEFEFMGVDLKSVLNLEPAENMYIISNSDGNNGASAILNKDAIWNFAKKINVQRFAIIPSSVHECIMIPNPIEDMGIEAMVRATKLAAVDPEEQLSDKPIYINLMEV